MIILKKTVACINLIRFNGFRTILFSIEVCVIKIVNRGIIVIRCAIHSGRSLQTANAFFIAFKLEK